MVRWWMNHSDHGGSRGGGKFTRGSEISRDLIHGVCMNLRACDRIASVWPHSHRNPSVMWHSQARYDNMPSSEPTTTPQVHVVPTRKAPANRALRRPCSLGGSACLDWPKGSRIEERAGDPTRCLAKVYRLATPFHDQRSTEASAIVLTKCGRRSRNLRASCNR